MRKMGIYLGLVEDDEAGYDRYAARRPGYADEPGYGRYADDGYAESGYTDSGYVDTGYADTGYADTGYAGYDRDYPAPRAHAEPVTEQPAVAVDPAPPRAPVGARRTAGSVRPLGLAGTPSAGKGSTSVSAASTIGSGAARFGGSLGAAALAMPEPMPEPVAVAEPPVVVPAPAPKPYRITTLHPQTYNEARTIGERFRDGSPVIMNLTEMDDADAKRLVDFAAGLSFGLRGSIERVTAKVFLISPQDILVTAEDKARIREVGSTPS